MFNTRPLLQTLSCDVSKNGILAIQTLRNNLMASIRLASIATMLSSVIAVLMSIGNQDIGVLLSYFTFQRAVYEVLQPCKFPHHYCSP
uniref:Uncharacterized protein n=1 Tax=Quercus lobata TaxID=97700 RepID=A0A7N2MHL0_QUELO